MCTVLHPVTRCTGRILVYGGDDRYSVEHALPMIYFTIFVRCDHHCIDGICFPLSVISIEHDGGVDLRVEVFV